MPRRSRGDPIELHAVFNFSDENRTVWMPERAEYVNLVSDVTAELETIELPSWDFVWMVHDGRDDGSEGRGAEG